jgi:hypothetical protein
MRLIHRCFNVRKCTGSVLTATGESADVIRFRGSAYFLGTIIDVYIADIECAVLAATVTCRDNNIQWVLGPGVKGGVYNFNTHIGYPLRLSDENMWPVPEHFISRELKAPDPVNLRTRPYVDPSEFGADEVEITTRKVSVIKQPEVANTVNPEIAALRRISNYSGTPQSLIEKAAAEPRYLSPTIPIGKRKPDKEKSQLWHGRLHCGNEKLQFCSRCELYGKRGLAIDPGEIDLDFCCEACKEAMAHKVNSHKHIDKDGSYLIGQCWHGDVAGRKNTPALESGDVLGILFRDRKSRIYKGYTARNNDASEIIFAVNRWNDEELEKWRYQYRNVPDFKFHLHTDNLEFNFPEVRKLLTTMGVTVHYTATESSSSNGLAERGIGVISDKERTLRIARNMPECFWADAFHIAIDLQNILPYRYRGCWHLDPYTDYEKKTFDYSRLRVPFSVCFAYNRHRVKGRDVRKGRKAIFCGYVPNSHNYKVWIISESKYEYTKDVTWDEKNLQPLIRQAILLEEGEERAQERGSARSDATSSTETPPQPDPVGTPSVSSQKSVATPVSKEGGANALAGQRQSEDEENMDQWLVTAMERIGNFLASATRGN